MLEAKNEQLRDVWDTDIEGAAAEIAYHKARGLHWPARISNLKGADCGDQVQIRRSKCLNGHLILREGDPEADC